MHLHRPSYSQRCTVPVAHTLHGVWGLQRVRVLPTPKLARHQGLLRKACRHHKSSHAEHRRLFTCAGAMIKFAEQPAAAHLPRPLAWAAPPPQCLQLTDCSPTPPGLHITCTSTLVTLQLSSHGHTARLCGLVAAKLIGSPPFTACTLCREEDVWRVLEGSSAPLRRRFGIGLCAALLLDRCAETPRLRLI